MCDHYIILILECLMIPKVSAWDKCITDPTPFLRGQGFRADANKTQPLSWDPIGGLGLGQSIPEPEKNKTYPIKHYLHIMYIILSISKLD